MKKKEEIYFAASIRGGREDTAIYLSLIEHLGKYGPVLTEHIGDKWLSVRGEDGLSDTFIHDRDMAWLRRAKKIVAEVTQASLGVGYEIGRTVERNLWVPRRERQSILCLYRPEVDRRLSAMIAGARSLLVREYRTIEEGCTLIDEFFKKPHNS